MDLDNRIVSAFLEVEEALQALCRHILFSLKELPAWGYHYGSETLVEDKGRILHALKHFGSALAASPQETLHCPGAIACKEETLALITTVNQAKLTFKCLIAAARLELRNEAIPFVHETLSKAGFPSIKLRHVTRTIHWINYHPRRIAWSRVKHSSNKLRTHEEIEKDLLAAGDGEHIDVQLNKLKSISSKEKLVVHREITEVWQFNVSSFKKEGRSSFQAGRTSLPLFYLHNPELPTPKICFSQTHSLPTRKQRSDKSIEDKVFLPSVHAYQYKGQESTRKS